MQNEQEKPWNYFRFEDLRVYHKALELSAWLREKTMVQSFSDDCEVNKLVSASTQVAIAIAEGSARNNKQFVYYLKVARSNAREVAVRSQLCTKLNILTKQQGEQVCERLIELLKMLSSLINSIQRMDDLISDDAPEEEPSADEHDYIDEQAE